AVESHLVGRPLAPGNIEPEHRTRGRVVAWSIQKRTLKVFVKRPRNTTSVHHFSTRCRRSHYSPSLYLLQNHPPQKRRALSVQPTTLCGGRFSARRTNENRGPGTTV